MAFRGQQNLARIVLVGRAVSENAKRLNRTVVEVVFVIMLTMTDSEQRAESFYATHETEWNSERIIARN